MKSYGWLIAAALLGMASLKIVAGDAPEKAQAKPAEKTHQVQFDLTVAEVYVSDLRRTDAALFKKWTELNSGTGPGPTLPTDGRDHLELLQQLKDRNLAKVVEARLATLSGCAVSYFSGGEVAIPNVEGLGLETKWERVPVGTRIDFLPVVQADHKVAFDLDVEISSSPPESAVEIHGIRILGRKLHRFRTTLVVDDEQIVHFGRMSQAHAQPNPLVTALGDCLPTFVTQLLSCQVQVDLILIGTPRIIVENGSNQRFLNVEEN